MEHMPGARAFRALSGAAAGGANCILSFLHGSPFKSVRLSCRSVCRTAVKGSIAEGLHSRPTTLLFSPLICFMEPSHTREEER